MQSGGKPNGLGARTVDYGLAAMELCGTFPQGFAARHIAGRLVRAATIRCWRLAAGCWWLDIADAKKDSRSVRRGNLF